MWRRNGMLPSSEHVSSIARQPSAKVSSVEAGLAVLASTAYLLDWPCIVRHYRRRPHLAVRWRTLADLRVTMRHDAGVACAANCANSVLNSSETSCGKW